MKKIWWVCWYFVFATNNKRKIYNKNWVWTKFVSTSFQFMGLVQFWCCQTRIEKYIELFWQETERERERMGVAGIHMVMERNGQRRRSRFLCLGLVLFRILTTSMTKTPLLGFPSSLSCMWESILFGKLSGIYLCNICRKLPI